MRAAGLAALLCAVVALAWFFRWEVVMPAASRKESVSPALYMLNRWTGEVRYVEGEFWFPVEPGK